MEISHQLSEEEVQVNRDAVASIDNKGLKKKLSEKDSSNEREANRQDKLASSLEQQLKQVLHHPCRMSSHLTVILL